MQHACSSSPEENLTAATRKTIELCATQKKPLFIVDLNGTLDVAAFRNWISTNMITVLNVAGPRESKHPGIAEAAQHVLTALLQQQHPQ